MNPIDERNAHLAKNVVEHLKARHFDAYYCQTGEEAKKLVLALVPEGSSVSWGGSVTLRQLGLTDTFHAGKYDVIDRDLGKTPEETFDLHRKALLADFFLTSTNALTQDGILVNIDGRCNRIAAMCFGPKEVIVLCSMQKVTASLEDAIARARNYAAPVNAVRLNTKTPCAVNGSCANCKSPDSICSQILITRLCKPAGRMKIILIGEALGY